MAEETQDGQKTLVSFVVGLLIGGMLVWAFSGPTASAPESVDEDEEAMMSEESTTDEGTESEMSEGEATSPATTAPAAPALKVGSGAIKVSDQPASASIKIDSAIYPISEGWVGVRSYNDDQLGSILGAVRFSESQGLVPENIELVVSTSPGNRYAVVVYTEDGSLNDSGRLWFNLDGDVQIDQIFDTFVAQ